MLLRRVPAACSWTCILLPVSLSLRPLQPPEICTRTEVPEFYEQIYRDLEPYKVLDEQHLAFYDGFCARRQKACIRLRIVNGAAYVLDMFPGYQSRHRSTLHAIYRVISRFGNLPDVEVTIDLTDGELQNIDLPFFVITHKKEAPVGVLYPDFTFYSWPESICPFSENEISHNYDQLFREFRQHWGVRARWDVLSRLLQYEAVNITHGGWYCTTESCNLDMAAVLVRGFLQHVCPGRRHAIEKYTHTYSHTHIPTYLHTYIQSISDPPLKRDAARSR